MHSTVCQSNASVLNTKIVNTINDGSNIVCVSCGKNVFMIPHEKCVARYALSRDSMVKIALFTTPIAVKSKNLRATSVVAKSGFSVAKTPTTTNKVSSASSLSPDSDQSRTLSNYMKTKIATSRKWQKWFEYQPCFNWTPNSKTAQLTPSVSKSSNSVTQLILWIVDSGCSKHMTGNLKLLRNFVEKFIGTFCFRNDHFAAITGYRDYVQGNLTICHVYYVEGLGHNLFSVGQFWYGDLEVAFPSNTCYVRNLKGGDLLTSSRKSNLYAISISELAASSLVCLMSKATSTKSWKKQPSTESKLELLHMDLCGPMRVESIIGKKYILVIVDDYSRYTWVYFLRTKDEAPDMIINFMNQIQRNLKAQILKIRTDNGTELKNEKLRSFYAKLGIVHHTSTAQTPQQNGVVEQRNRTLVKAARAMLIFSKTPEFLWAKAIATTCFTQNRSLVHTRYNKTPYELIRGRKPNFQYFHVFGSLCYPINDCNDLGKMKPKADIVIFIGYFESS
ncbi:retrovirus-related pol polyprotein from transposon TNT 1-94 [Tanacetum coccineum]